jgi:hypothetical protein
MPDRPTASLSQSAGAAGNDWPDEIADRIESVVGAVRSKTTVPVTRAARALVFGLVAGALGAVAFVLFVIGLVRLLDVYVPWHPLARRVWTVDAGAAAIFLAVGALAWRKRRPRERA